MNTTQKPAMHKIHRTTEKLPDKGVYVQVIGPNMDKWEPDYIEYFNKEGEPVWYLHPRSEIHLWKEKM